ncbi:NACHT domain-containing protein [Frigoriglobus tundricola]|uniref:NACHT domain-containing protein n=1 Tax=Frigoriglobus tundricola TaxID=2774151 RepID=UPI00187280C0|nr:NACHT domain-containing protein [Frigoriglobus tundricola]
MDESEAYRSCAFGLGVWFDQLDSERWTQLPACVPGENPVEIEKVYVELYAVASADADIESARADLPTRVARQQLSNQYPLVDIPTMLARTLQRCVVIGEPGAGKSTLVRWLAWAVHRGTCSDFKAALVVKLGAFAQALAENPQTSVVEFFFQSLGTRIDDWRGAAGVLRRIAATNHRFVLLLDGWDEVPPDQREEVRERITAEQAHFVTVITSRASGLPHQFRDGDRVDVYQIAGLAEPARDELVRKLLAVHGRPELVEPVLHRIGTEPDLREMAANPFLLGLLVRVLSRAVEGRAPLRTLADVYHQLTDWVRDQHNQLQSEPDQLTADHVTGLRSLSHRLLFGSERPRYLFRRQELQELMPRASDEPVCRSRFVNRTDPVFDEYAFLHATLQEHFAAVHADALAASELDAFLDRAFRSSSRLIVLEFLAGQHTAAGERCRQRAGVWLQERDRFQQVVLRVARLAAAGRWTEEEVPNLVPGLRAELWSEIEANRDMKLTKLAVEAFAELDPTDLARRARASSGLDNWTIQCITESVPPSIRRQERLDELMVGEWRDYAGLDARGGATARDLDAIRSVLANPGAAEEDRRVAVIQAGAARDGGAVAALVKLLRAESTSPDLLEKVLDSLGVIAGRAAVDALVGVVLGTPALADEAVRVGIGVLRHRGFNKKALDPVGRDRLVRQLAALPPDAPGLEPILQALEGCPIREGAAVIEEIAQAREAPVGVRAAAVLALTGVMDRARLQRFIATIGSEPSGEVAEAMLLLSVTRSVRAPRDWLEAAILKTHDKRKLGKLLPAYLLMLVNVQGPERAAAYGFLNRQLATVLVETGASGEERATAWERALGQTRLPPECLTPDTLQLARDELARFTARPDPAYALRVRLVTCLAGHLPPTTARAALREAFSASLRFEETAPGALGLVPQVLANRLVEIAPAELLRYPIDCESATSVLRSRAVERHWLVFQNRIIDAEGNEIATISNPDPLTPLAADAPDLREIAERLPDRSRRVLLAYWWMVRDGGPCEPGDTFRHIYDRTTAFWAGEEETEANYLRTLFPEALPAFENWKKTLNRIQKQFTTQPAILTQLHRIGLHSRRRR